MKKINVALIGYKFMGRAHSNAWRQVASFFDVPAEGRVPEPDFEDGVHNQKVLGAFERASASRRWERV